MSRSEGMCDRLKVLASSRHNGPAFIAVTTSSMAEKAVPISAADVSIPSFGIPFNDMRLEIERQNYRPSIIDFGVSRRRAKIQRRRSLRDPFHARITCADCPHRPCFVSHQEALSQRIGSNPAECK